MKKLLKVFDQISIRMRIAVLLGLLMRLLLAPFTMDMADIPAWYVYGHALSLGINPYLIYFRRIKGLHYRLPFAYPPLFLFYASLSDIITERLLGVPFSKSRPPLPFRFLIKVPVIIADIASSLFIYYLTLKRFKEKRKAEKYAFLFLFNPFVILVSSFWGMFDSIPTCLLLFSVYYLLNKRYTLSGILFGIAVCLKGFFPGFLLPILLIKLLSENFQIKRRIYLMMKFLILSIGPTLISMVPFVAIPGWGDIYAILYSIVFFQLERMPQQLVFFSWVFRSYYRLVKVNLLPEWLQPYRLAEESTRFFVTAFPLSYMLSLILLSILVIKKRAALTNIKQISEGILLIILGYYSTSKVVNEQHFMWSLPFFILSSFPHRCIFVLMNISVTVFILLDKGPLFFWPIKDIGIVNLIIRRWHRVTHILYPITGWMSLIFWTSSLIGYVFGTIEIFKRIKG
mgnify:CR=1 FL=1